MKTRIFADRFAGDVSLIELLKPEKLRDYTAQRIGELSRAPDGAGDVE